MQKNIIPLEKEFTGKGEVRNMRFLQLYSSKKAYLYQVGRVDCHYEVFERKNAPFCNNFENKEFSKTEFKEIYPNSKNFGMWAWTYQNLDKALEKFNNLTNAPEI